MAIECIMFVSTDAIILYNDKQKNTTLMSGNDEKFVIIKAFVEDMITFLNRCIVARRNKSGVEFMDTGGKAMVFR